MNTEDLIKTARIAAESQDNIALKMLLIMLADKLSELSASPV